MERELLLLGLLRQREMHGYQLHEFINRNLASCTDMKKPTAYHLLDKMVERGWLTAQDDAESSRPPRRIYQLTAEGEAAYQTLLRENLRGYYPTVFSGSIGLAFIESLPTPEAHTLLSERRAAMLAALDGLRLAPPHSGSFNLVIEHQTAHLEAELIWLDRLLARLADEST